MKPRPDCQAGMRSIHADRVRLVCSIDQVADREGKSTTDVSDNLTYIDLAITTKTIHIHIFIPLIALIEVRIRNSSCILIVNFPLISLRLI